MNSKETTLKIVEILKQVAPEGTTRKQQWHKIYLLLKKMNPSIPKLRFKTETSINELKQQANKEAIEAVMKTIPDSLKEKSLEQQPFNEDPATNADVYLLEEYSGTIATAAEEAAEEELSLDTDFLYPCELDELSPAQIKGWAKMQAADSPKTLKQVLIEVAESLPIASGGKIDELTQAIHDKINE